MILIFIINLVYRKRKSEKESSVHTRFDTSYIKTNKDELQPLEKLLEGFSAIPMPLLPPSEHPSVIPVEQKDPNEYEGHFKDGKLFDVKPRNNSISLADDREVAYKARYIYSDGVKYDLEDAESINSMPIPKFDRLSDTLGVTGDLSYIMKMKAYAEDRPQLAVPLTYKAVNLMISGPIGWTKKDYFTLLKHLWFLGETDYADHLLSELNKDLSFKNHPLFDEEYARSCSRDYWLYKYKERLEYQKIVDLLKDKAPKSYNGYVRMKNQNTANFQKIKEMAKENNIELLDVYK